MRPKHLLAAGAVALLLVSWGKEADAAGQRWTAAPYMAVPPLAVEDATAVERRIAEITAFPHVLDERLWAGDRLKPDVRARTLEIVDDLFARLRLAQVKVGSVEVQGSNVSFEYDDRADFGVKAFLDTSSFQGSVAELSSLLKQYNQLIEVEHEGRVFFHGVPLEINFYAVRTRNLEPRPGIGNYSLTADAWVEKPTVQENRFDQGKMLEDAQTFIATYNELVSAYFADKRAFDCQQFADFAKGIRTYRAAGLDRDGTRSTENLTYRLLRRLDVNIVELTSDLELECRNVHWSLE